MKIAILSRGGTLYPCKRLHEAVIQRGHLVEIPDPFSCHMSINPATPSIHYRGYRLPYFDAAIPCIGTTITSYGAAVLCQLEMLGSCLLNGSAVTAQAHGRLRSM